MGDAYWQRGVWLQKRGATVDALKELNRALELNPSRFEAYATIARCLSDQTKYADAKDAWRRAIDGNPNMPEWRYRLGKILIDENSIDAAAPHLKAAVDITMERKQTPGWLWNANWLLGEALYHRDPKRALVAYKEFLRLTPSDNAYRDDGKARIEELESK
jgi:tetratricopeptide (TPR) repeat protein